VAPLLRAVLDTPPRVFASASLSFVLLLGMLVAGNLLIFEDFILGDRCLLFEDWGGDSVQHNLPVMHYFSTRDALGGYWIHASALGNNVFMFPWLSVFNPILPVLGWNTTVAEFAHRIVYYAVIQSLLAGIFFYWFLLRSGRSTFAAIASSCAYALCGAFTASSTWMVMLAPPLLAGLAIVLWAYKVWQQDGRWYVFSAAIFYFAASTQPLVTLYQLAVFLGFYLFFDFVSRSEGFSRKALPSFVLHGGKTALAGAVGLLAFAFFLLPHTYYAIFHTARPATAWIPLFALPHVKDVLAAFLRLFSNDLIGTANLWTYRYEHKNYMELPFLYCGQLLVLVLPAYCLIRGYGARFRREQLALAGLLLPLALGQLLPGLRAYLFFGGKAAYVRWTSVFMVAALAIAGSRALELLVERRRPGKTTGMVISSMAALLIGALTVSYLTAAAHGLAFDPLVYGVVVATILGYAFLVHVRRPTARYCGVLGLLLAELAFQGHRTVSFARTPLTKADDSGKRGTSGVYSSRSILESIALVKRAESGSFFRLSKTAEYGDKVDNSSLCQGYNGTRGYTTFNNPATVAFFDDRRVANQNAYLPGFQERYLLDALVGVKYYIRRGELPIPPWAVHLTSIGHVDIYRNPRALPLGVVYDRYMFEAEFRALPLREEEKDLLLLSVAVLPEDTLARKPPGWESLSHVTGPVSPSNDDAAVHAAVEQKQENGLQVTSFQNDVIAGKIEADRSSLVFFSIPHDPGWRVTVDETEVEKLRLQIGFLGAFLPAGSHTIRLEYRPPYYRLGLAVSLSTVIGMIVALGFFRRRLPSSLATLTEPPGEQGSSETLAAPESERGLPTR
jgi:uncharacterized membrane protein YfhO